MRRAYSIESVYGSEKDYQFGCAFIRSLHGEKKKGDNDYDRVPCAGDMCPCIKGNTDVAEEAINLPLAKTSDASLTGKLITTRVMVAGKKHTPYVVPKKVEYSCWGQEKCKKYGCPLLNIPTATAYKELNAHNRELIQMTETGDDNIKGILREISGIPSCGKYDTSIVETINVDELLVIPRMQVNAKVKARETGYAETIYGYKRLLPAINSSNRYTRSEDERRAANTPVQGSAADIMKRAQNTVYEKCGMDTASHNGIAVEPWDGYATETKELLGCKPFMLHGHTDMVAQIHDEIIVELDDDTTLVDTYAKWQKAVMEVPPLKDFPVQLEAEASVAYSWGNKMSLEDWEKARGL